MKKITLLLFLALTSCGIEYDGETRLISETTVLDRNGNYLAIEVKPSAVAWTVPAFLGYVKIDRAACVCAGGV